MDRSHCSRVSPALAGMDPLRHPSRSTPCGFPRTRGDGPAQDGGQPGRLLFPPHSRGWTLIKPRHEPAALVSPALAGMDRSSRASGSGSSCFPRTRGDGPLTVPTGAIPTQFPPHSRGWTRRASRRMNAARVSPALAGMDRSGRPGAFPWSRFPRTRGDGPWSQRTCRRMSEFPPHSRGWTAQVRGDHCYFTVSPALAGMDRFRLCSGTSRSRFPRTRGDGPSPASFSMSLSVFPPHSRGWTLRHDGRRRQGRVSPALAGMDPSPGCGSGRTGCFPRTRGDGPDSGWVCCAELGFPPHSRGWTGEGGVVPLRCRVSPALAGMDPSATSSPTTRSSFPRTRGDGPIPKRLPKPTLPFPPHSRGGTAAAASNRYRLEVSPALAGMDRALNPWPDTSMCFPRTRGDGPRL